MKHPINHLVLFFCVFFLKKAAQRGSRLGGVAREFGREQVQEIALRTPPRYFKKTNDLVARGASRRGPVATGLLCVLHDRRVGHSDVINVGCGLNPGQEELFPNSLETHLGLVGRSAFDLDWVYKHTDLMVIVAQDQSVEFIIRKSSKRVCTWGERLAIQHKLEGQRYTNLASNVCLGSQTEHKNASECKQNTREFSFHNFSY
jgi:hypothetical protein